MFRPCANDRVNGRVNGYSALAVAAMLGFLSACGSSPSKDTAAKSDTQVADTSHAAKKAESAKKTDSKKAAVEQSAPPEPVGPPPVPPEATQQFEKALTLLGAGDFAAATKELQRLSETYPNYPGPLANLGIVYLKTGKLTEAEKALKAATQRGEPSASTFNQLGIVYRKLGRFKEADEAYSQASRVDPSYALAHLNLGVLCDLYLQQPQRALEEFQKYLQLVPKPDARVPAWVKELQSRVGGGKSQSSTPPAAAPSAPPPIANPVANKEAAGT